MSDINTTIVAGRLTRDPEIRYTTGGKPVATLSIANNRKSKDKEHTSYFDVVVWGKSAEAAAQYLKKGSGVLVEGSLRHRTWEGKEGERREKVEINCFTWHFMGGKSEGQSEAKAPVSNDAVPPEDGDVPF